MNKLLVIILLPLVFVLPACGTDTSSGSKTDASTAGNGAGNDVSLLVTNDPDSSNPQPGDATFQQAARVSLSLTDAPLDNVVKVVVSFLSVEFIRESPAKSYMYTFNTPLSIDLLNLQGVATEPLLSDMEIEAGSYREIRLLVDDSNMNSYIELDDGSVYELKIPSGSSSGLKLKGDFIFAADQVTAYTVDFDVRKSVVMAGSSGGYLLKPVLRLVQNDEVGHIRGSVDSELLTADDCSDTDVDTYNAVYVFEGFDITPTDINVISNEDHAPVTTALVKYDNNSGNYIYEAAYLPAGDYTISFTCNSDKEDPEKDDDLLFFNTQNVSVEINNILFL